MKPLAKIPVPWVWYLGIGGIILMSVVVSLSMLTFLPHQMPARVSSGIVAIGGAYAPAMGWQSLLARVIAGPLLTLVISLGLSLLISSQSTQLAQNHPTASPAQLARRWGFLNTVQASLGWFSFFLAAILAISAVRVNGPGEVSPVELAAYAVAIAGLAWVMLVSLRRGQVLIDRAIPVRERERDPKWRMVYYNPSDRRVFVELDDGQTTVVNMARPGAWAILVLMIIPALFIVGLVIYVS